MKLRFHQNFNKDLLKQKDATLAKQVRKLILRLENTGSFSDIPNLKKLQGGPNYFRIRLGDYRIGIIREGDAITLMRILHRKEIYRYFP